MRRGVAHGVQDVPLGHGLAPVAVAHVLLGDDLQRVQLPVRLGFCQQYAAEGALACSQSVS